MSREYLQLPGAEESKSGPVLSKRAADYKSYMSAVSNIEMRPFAVRTALIVDDDPQIQALLRRILEPKSWGVRLLSVNMIVLLLQQGKTLYLIFCDPKTYGLHVLNCI